MFQKSPNPPQAVMKISRGRGVAKSKDCKEIYGAKFKFPEGWGGIYIFWKLTLFLFDRQVLSVDFVGFVENSWNFFFLPTDFHTSCLYCFTIPLLSCILDSYNRPGMYITLLWPFWVITLAFCQITLSSGSSALQPSIFNIFLSAGWLVPTLWPAGAWDGFILYLSIGQMEKRMYCILNVTGDFRPKRPG